MGASEHVFVVIIAIGHLEIILSFHYGNTVLCPYPPTFHRSPTDPARDLWASLQNSDVSVMEGFW